MNRKINQHAAKSSLSACNAQATGRTVKSFQMYWGALMLAVGTIVFAGQALGASKARTVFIAPTEESGLVVADTADVWLDDFFSKARLHSELMSELGSKALVAAKLGVSEQDLAEMSAAMFSLECGDSKDKLLASLLLVVEMGESAVHAIVGQLEELHLDDAADCFVGQWLTLALTQVSGASLGWKIDMSPLGVKYNEQVVEIWGELLALDFFLSKETTREELLESTCKARLHNVHLLPKPALEPKSSIEVTFEEGTCLTVRAGIGLDRYILNSQGSIFRIFLDPIPDPRDQNGRLAAAEFGCFLNKMPRILSHYIVQEGMIDFEDDIAFRKWLLQYEDFKQAGDGHGLVVFWRESESGDFCNLEIWRVSLNGIAISTELISGEVHLLPYSQR